MKRKKNKSIYPNGGDGMFFYHKKTRHPAKQISHNKKVWFNKRYTHSPNRLKDYIEDKTLSTEENKVYVTKKVFEDSIYTRGQPYNMKSYKKSVDEQRVADRRTIKFRNSTQLCGELASAKKLNQITIKKSTKKRNK